MPTTKELTKDRFTIREINMETQDKKHTLYVQEWGNHKGTPILYLHGGPGSGCNNNHKKLFNPDKHRVVFHDQRGSGQSTPQASMEANSTENLIVDINQITKELGIETFVLVGRSWGSTLALCYAIQYPERVQSIVTGGVFLGTRPEIDWVEKGEFRAFLPEVWENYGAENLDLMAYAQCVAATLSLDDRYPELAAEDFDPSKWTIEMGYMDKNCFLDDNYILKNAKKITMPVTIVQGRYDMMTPPKFAYSLHKALPGSSLLWTIAGHSSSDRANFDSTKAAISQL